MHFYFRLLLACLVLLCLSGNSIAKHKEEAKEEAKKEPEKNKDKETPSSGKGGPYGIVATAKASNNRSCRATWYVAAPVQLLVTLRPHSSTFTRLGCPTLTLAPPSPVS